MKTIDEIPWMAYVDGELDTADRAADRSAVEAAMAADPQLAAAVAAQQQLRSRLQRGLAAELDEPVPDRLSALLAPAPALATATTAGPVLAAPSPQGQQRWWLFAAAGLAAGLLLPRLLPDSGADLRLQGPLAMALEQRLSAEAAGPDGWQMRLSYRDQQGRLCRGFSGATQAGLACKGGDGQWQLAMLVPAESQAGELRQAASPLPPALLEAVDAQLVGQALDAKAEAEARQAGWR